MLILLYTLCTQVAPGVDMSATGLFLLLMVGAIYPTLCYIWAESSALRMAHDDGNVPPFQPLYRILFPKGR